MTERGLPREEYIEQAYFFRVYRERLQENITAQECLLHIREEILATTKLPMALDFLALEIQVNGRISDGMTRLPHYFTPFQTFVMSRAEADRSRFDVRVALEILERESKYRAAEPTVAGLFIFQFECIARNRLGYDGGMTAMADDPLYDEDWREWIRKIRLKLGEIDFADLVYYRSEHYVDELRRRRGEPVRHPILFGTQEGRIAKANRGKDPLFMFAALNRQLGYPSVPRPVPESEEPVLHPALEQRLQRIEKRLQLLESEMKGGIDLSEFYAKLDRSESINSSPADNRDAQQ